MDIDNANGNEQRSRHISFCHQRQEAMEMSKEAVKSEIWSGCYKKEKNVCNNDRV